MEDIKPKKERKFLKAVGKVAGILLQEFVLGLGRKFIGKKIDRIGNKRHALLIFLALFCNIAFASVDSIPYPITGNKQRLGWQTSGNGLVWRGLAADTITKPTSYADKNVKAYLILDSVSGSLYVFKQGVWAAISSAGGGLTMPFDSITFNTAKDGTVGVGEVEYNDTQGSLIQGLKGGNVTNVIGQQLHQRVNNRTGATLNKGDVVYLSGSQGNRITVAKGLAVTDAFSANTFGVVAESIADNQSGFIITEGLITGLNTSALTEDSAVYLSPTVAGALTSTKPQAPQHSVYIGVCVKSNNGSGELFVKIRNGLEMDELHDTRITNPVTGAILYYSGGLWRDTTAALLVSDTASMLSNYATKAYADTTGRLYARQDFTNVLSSTLTWTQSDTLIPGGVNVVQVYRNGQILLPSQYTIPTSTSVVIAASSFKVNDNYTVIFPRGGGAGSGGGSGSLTSISAGTGITVSPNPITTTGTVSADLSILMELSDTVSLSNRINLKLNATDTASLSNRINAKLNISDTLSMLSPYFRDADTSLLNLTSRFALKLNATDTASLSNRINAKGNGTVTSVATGYGLTGGTITTTGTLLLDSAVVFSRIRDSIVDVAIGNDTIKILKQEYAPATSSVLTWTVTPKFPIQLKAYILVFRNGQLLINDQYNLTDTNKITIVSNSFKLNSNYTVVTVSGIGSVGSAQAGNPVYPDAGIALSTGSTWASSIPNNSSNWNTAYNDKINSLAVTGTTTKTITLTQQDGGTVSGNFTDNGSVTSVDMTVPTGLSISGNPITTNGTLALSYASGYSLPTDANQNNWTIAYNDKIASLAFTGTSTKTLTLNQTDGGTVSNTFTDLQGVTSVTAGTGLTGGTITSTGTVAVDFGVVAPLANPTFTGTVSGITKNMVGLGSVDNTSDANKPISTATQTALNGKENTITAGTTGQYYRGDKTFQTLDKSVVGLGNVDNTSDANKPVSTATQTALNGKENTITAGTTGQYFRGDKTFQTLDKSAVGLGNVDNTTDLNKPISTATQTALNLKVNISDTASMLTPYFQDADTTSLNLTSRFNTKQNTLSGTGFVKATGTSITYDNSTYLTTGTAASTYLPLTGGTLTGGLTGTTGTFTGLNVNNTTTEGIFSLQGYDNNTATRIQFKTGNIVRQEIIKPTSASNLQFRSYPTGTAQGGYDFYVSNGSTESLAATIGTDKSLSLTGTLGVTGATTLSSTLAVTGNITEAGNNVLTNLDTASLSSRIDSKFNSSGGTISGKAILNDSARFEGNVLFKKNMGLPIVKISNADYTATTSNHTIIYTTLTADKTLTIPNASDAVGVKFVISIFDIPEGNEALTLVTPGSNLFVRTDGENSSVDIVGGYCTTIQSDGIKWYILSYAPMY